MKPILKKLIPYIAVIAGFLVLSYAYAPEVLQGKIVNQSDISSWRGMANETITYNEAHPDDKTLWTGSMFSGMPTFSISTKYEGNTLDPLYSFMFWGHRPPSYLFISLVGAFLLMLAFGANIWLAVAGAVAVTFCSYNMEIIQVGHNSKMVAIAFMPWALAALVYSYRKNALIGSALFAIAIAFQIKANHPQITYYLAIIIFGYAIAELCGAIKAKKLPSFIKTSVMVLVGGLLGIATNANMLIPTYEYSKYTMRGGSELSADEDVKTGGLKIDYATNWSYGINEMPNLMIPNYNGGSSSGTLDRNSNTYKVLKGRYQGAEQLIRQLPSYWGPQPFTAGPMYMGAVSVFLFVLGLILVRDRYKWWIVGVTAIAVMLSWGSHFMWFSEIWFKHVPMYNKFRTVSMILVILQMTIPIMAILGVKELFATEPTKENSRKMLKSLAIATAITAGFCLIVGLVPSLAGSFVSSSDASLPGDITSALQQDRQALLSSDAFRSLGLILATAAILWISAIAGKIKPIIAYAAIAVLILGDLWTVDRRYLNKSHFFNQKEFNSQYAERPVDKYIHEDTDPSYRVLDISVNTFNDAIVSYHHKTIGGYSPAKLQRYQDLIDYYISPEMSKLTSDLNASMKNAQTVSDLENGLGYYPILSMLNTRYIVFDGKNVPVRYSKALGNAWFVSNTIPAKNADEEIGLLSTIDPAETAVIYTGEGATASAKPVSDGDRIEMKSYAPNRLEYSYSSAEGGLAVFSEIYYPAGWTATIDDKEELEIMRADWTLRALNLPAGNHKVTFAFHPESYYTGKNISLCTSLAIWVALLAAIAGQVLTGRKKKEEE